MVNLKLNPFKCNFFRCEISDLGHIISAKGVQIDLEKISAVENGIVPHMSTYYEDL